MKFIVAVIISLHTLNICADCALCVCVCKTCSHTMNIHHLQKCVAVQAKTKEWRKKKASAVAGEEQKRNMEKRSTSFFICDHRLWHFLDLQLRKYKLLNHFKSNGCLLPFELNMFIVRLSTLLHLIYWCIVCVCVCVHESKCASTTMANRLLGAGQTEH